MIKYKNIYIKFFDLIEGDFIACELCGAKAVDLHHIQCKGTGGTTNEFVHSIENLMALTRELHDKHGDIANDKEWLRAHHMAFLNAFEKSGKDYEEFIQTYKFPLQ